ncbi:molybdopterin converting factor subunit 1 [Tunicatimonas pelagia]|uniref:molybdopterin converting factor subunit 1 n=1 Tax=Tunicatimonas pelagia TaxID=931531 RepID=UPI0026662927|nr:molybdopterin converting factor subunit 1 [Tunicatimonas pelagia]WKN46212.1 molybdopterin converting factor subunit 1 [Tunicatimonas pelagia]
MELNILLFGITKDIVGQQKLRYELPEGATVPDLVAHLKKSYPKLHDLNSVMIAVNNEYGQEDQTLHESDEVALIPPVSGG